MSISEVKLVSIIGVMSAVDDIIKICGKSGFFHPDDAMSFYAKTDNFTHLIEENPYKDSLKKLKSVTNRANISLNMVSIEDFDVSIKEINEYVSYINSKLSTLLNQKQEIINKINQYNNTQSNISRFVGLNLNLKEIFSCKYIKVRFGKLPNESYQKLSSYKDDPYMLFFPCTSDDMYCWGVYFTPLENASDVDRKFAKLSFERLKIYEEDGTPESKLEYIKNSIKNANSELDLIDKKIESFWKTQKDQCLRFYTKLEEMTTYFGIKKYVSKYKESFILVGWIPEDKEEQFSRQLNDVYGIEYSIESAENSKKHSPPVRLKNNRFSRPFESFVEMYGLPSYDEIDPTVVVSILYTLLFGIMFGDVGQGLVLSLVGAAIWKMKKMLLGKIMIRCGFSATVFGFIYGSVFGLEHVLDPIYKLLFNVNEKPIEVMNPSTVLIIILSAVALGATVILMSMVLNVYSSLKRRDYESAVFGQNGIAGIVFYGSLMLGMALSLLLKVNIMNIFYVLIFLILPIVLIFFKEPLGKLMAHNPNWKPEKWGEYIVQNSFEMFEILLSYITNTMSFLRVGAYVLVHAGMMLAVYKIAEIVPGNVIGYPIVAILGNIFVIAMEGLLVGIQVLRLNFYELFSRFFEGEGRPFAPVKVADQSL